MTTAARSDAAAAKHWGSDASALHRIALAVAHPSAPTLFDDLMREMAASLHAAVVFIGVFTDASRRRVQAIAPRLDGGGLRSFEYDVEGTPCAAVVGRDFLYVERGVAAEFARGSLFAAKGMDSYAAYPLCDRDGVQLGFLVAMDRGPLRDAALAEAVLKIVGIRIVAELERGRAEEALRRSEESYRAIFEASEDGIVIHDFDTGAMLDFNPKALEMSGYSRDEVRGATIPLFSAQGGADAEADARRHLAAAQQGERPRFEWQRRNRDGSLHWDEVRLRTVTLAGVPRILSFSRDITERKRADAALRGREEQYRAVFEASSDAFVLRDASHDIVDANPAFMQLYGFSREQLRSSGGYPPDFPPEYVAERRERVQRALHGEASRVETVALRPDGSTFDAELRVIPMRYRGEPHVLSVIRDVSERRMRERAVQRSEARLRATVDAAFDSIVGMDGECAIVEFNAEAERTFGRRRAEVLGLPLADVIFPERLRADYAQSLARYAKTGVGPFAGRLVETTAMRADGSEFPVELAISVAAAPGGDIYVGYLRDISLRRQAEAQRLELESQLRQAQKMEAIGQLTGGIAHDFNNILTSVTGYVVLAMERAERLGDATIVRQLGQAHLAAQRAADLISQMLAFARRQRSERRPLDLAAEVRRSVQLLRSTLPSRIELDVASAAGTPAVVGDSVQIEQVLFNLCINARDAIDGAGTIGIAVGSETIDGACDSCREPLEGRWVVLSVSDTGSGVAPDAREHLFEPFYTTKPAGRGSGMGLAMVHGIVHGHGGHLLVDDAVPHGAAFKVLLPAADADAAGASVDASPSIVPSSLAGRVLLVEDEAMAAAFMVELLSGWGLQVTHCADPLDAERRLADASSAFDVLLTDQTMPGLSGLELARRAAALRPGLPALLYSGFGEGIDDADLRRAGVRALLRKPIDRAALQAALAAALPLAA